MTTPMTEPVRPSRVIRCTGFGCSKKLADITGPTLEIKCPRCSQLRCVEIVELVAVLVAYLEAVQLAAQPNGPSAGGGFLL
jgi:phage FluMu protein Com